MGADPPPIYRVDLQPLGGSAVPDIHALRRLLKVLLRAYGLKALRAEELVEGIDPEVLRLRQLVSSLAARCHGQSELLARLAERQKASQT